jgi:anti-sigma B factor antagonist
MTPYGRLDTGQAGWAFRLEVVDEPGAVRLIPCGELDRFSRSRLLAEVAERLARGATLVVVDLTHTTLLDSSGLQALIELDREASAGDHRIAFVPGPSQVQRVLRLTGMLDRLPFVDAASP